MLHWTSLLLFFGLALLAIWVTYTFFGKVGMYFFAIVANVVCSYFAEVQLCGFILRISMAIMPVVFLAIYVIYLKYGKLEAKRLFYVALVSKIIMFILRFFEFAFLDLSNQTITNLTWMSLRYHVGSVVAFGLAGLIMYIIVEYVNMSKIENFFKVDIYIAVPSLINCLVQFIIAYTGYHKFSDILFAFLFSMALVSVLSLVLACVEILFRLNLFENKQHPLAKETIGDSNNINTRISNSSSYSTNNSSYTIDTNTRNTTVNSSKEGTQKKGFFNFGKQDKKYNNTNQDKNINNKEKKSAGNNTDNSTKNSVLNYYKNKTENTKK